MVSTSAPIEELVSSLESTLPLLSETATLSGTSSVYSMSFSSTGWA